MFFSLPDVDINLERHHNMKKLFFSCVGKKLLIRTNRVVSTWRMFLACQSFALQSVPCFFVQANLTTQGLKTSLRHLFCHTVRFLVRSPYILNGTSYRGNKTVLLKDIFVQCCVVFAATFCVEELDKFLF